VFDWIDPTTNAPAKPVLQPLLLASRKSCNGQGVWYPQAGDHTFCFALTTHDGGWRNGRQDGIGANHPFHIVTGATPATGASLPPEMSFASVSTGNVIVSTIKKCEDDDSVIARVYDIEGKDSEVALKLFKPVKSAEKTSLIEAGGTPLVVAGGSAKITVGHHAIETMKLKQP
jgi:alpha-mannosidase